MAVLIGDVSPTTLDGVKSLAAQMRKKQGIKHSSALDLAAQAAKCANFRDAKRKLPNQGLLLARPYVLLTVYWRDKDRRHQVGRETLRIELSRPVFEICNKSALKNVRGFSDLRLVAEDHFVSDSLAQTQAYAHECLCTAERSVRFIEYTGLHPSRDYRKAYPSGLADQLPNSDHSTNWFDPLTGQFVLIDEPYSGVPEEAKRTAWASRVGWQLTKSSWPGMYNPYNCQLYAASDGRSDYDLNGLVAKIDAMPAPLLAKDWPGETSSSWDTFFSPLAKTAQDKRRARSRGTVFPSPSASSLPYSYSYGSSRRRPAGKMGIDGHIIAGRILKAVLREDKMPHGVYRRIAKLRSMLEDWMSLEIDRGQLEGPEFFDVYYHESDGDGFYHERAGSRAGIIKMLGDLKASLVAHYPDCAPLRQQVHRIDMSVALVDKLKSAVE